MTAACRSLDCLRAEGLGASTIAQAALESFLNVRCPTHSSKSVSDECRNVQISQVDPISQLRWQRSTERWIAVHVAALVSSLSWPISYKSCNLVIRPNCVGMVPEILLENAAKYVQLLHRPSCVGSVPLTKLYAQSKQPMFALPSCVGIVPLSDVFATELDGLSCIQHAMEAIVQGTEINQIA
jgi:hypothetical protein